MKKILLTAMLAAGLVLPTSARVNTLRVVPLSGTPVLFHIEGKPSITKKDNTITVTAGESGNPEIFQIEDILHIDFIDNGQGAVLPVEDKENRIEVTRAGHTLHIKGIPVSSHIHIFSADGHLVSRATAEDSHSIDFSGYPPGVYIIRINDFSFKTRF